MLMSERKADVIRGRRGEVLDRKAIRQCHAEGMAVSRGACLAVFLLAVDDCPISPYYSHRTKLPARGWRSIHHFLVTY
jgi:hypothetical protein